MSRRAHRLESLASGESEPLRKALRAIEGIGPWTSEVVVSAALGDPDAVPIGDYNLPSLVAFNLAGEPRADDARMLELLEPYRGHRGRALSLLLLGGKSPPRWGPRLKVNDIRGR